MKKFLLIAFLLSFHFAYAKTGTNDGFLFLLTFCAILLFILAVRYSIDIIRKIIKQRKEKKLIDFTDNSNNENIS
ncbi:MAG: hypothetical protein WCH34_02670 [Bacteroidota bacterium]